MTRRLMTKIHQDLLLKNGLRFMINHKKIIKLAKKIRIKIPALRSDLSYFSDAYIMVKGDVTVTETDIAKRDKSVAFKNNTPFINSISKINGVETDNAKDVDVVITMYNLLEYSKNLKKKTTGSLWNYYRDEPSNPLSSNSEPFKYKTSITGNVYNLVAGDANLMQTKLVIMKLKFLLH